MKRFLGIALVTVATLAVTLVVNVGFLAGFPWSDKILHG